ncbi:MAG TPA: Uma2 family endonuclease [Ardenticatenaceae bacterium]|nr:Uma2 family endonuclease [Ardenticatenaceae bacterium]
MIGDIGPAELVEGRIVPGTLSDGEHGGLKSNLAYEIGLFVRQRGLGRVLTGGIYTRRNPDSVRGADIAFYSNQRMPGKLPKGYLEIAPDLVVEIMSPFDRWSEVREKVEEYFSIGVSQMWIVEPANHALFVYRSPVDVQRLAETDTHIGEGVLEGFSLPVARIFDV